jgi:hypothetical protein
VIDRGAYRGVYDRENVSLGFLNYDGHLGHAATESSMTSRRNGDSPRP